MCAEGYCSPPSHSHSSITRESPPALYSHLLAPHPSICAKTHRAGPSINATMFPQSRHHQPSEGHYPRATPKLSQIQHAEIQERRKFPISREISYHSDIYLPRGGSPAVGPRWQSEALARCRASYSAAGCSRASHASQCTHPTGIVGNLQTTGYTSCLRRPSLCQFLSRLSYLGKREGPVGAILHVSVR